MVLDWGILMEYKSFKISFSSEVENKNEWLKAFEEDKYTCLKQLTACNIVVFVGEAINKEDWELARSFKKLIYNLTGLSVEAAMEMLKILLDNTDWREV